MPLPDPHVRTASIGWDVGGAHIKACLVAGGRVRDVAQWPAPLWQGLESLDAAIDAARARWPEFPAARHAATMTAEMVDLFPDREAGVRALVDRLACRLGPALRCYAGPRAWLPAVDAATRWREVASANWLATAQLVGAMRPNAVLIDIGSTTTDLIALAGGAPCTRARSDAERLAGGELVYLGVVRTPLCALAPRIDFGGATYNVMRELFATSADVFRLTGELDPTADQHPAADGGDKDEAASARRLARMIGMDAREAPLDAWRGFAQAWRTLMLDELAGQLDRVSAALPSDAPVVGAGCGLFLARTLAERAGRPFLAFHQLACTDPGAERCTDTCAPAVAVARLYERWHQAAPGGGPAGDLTCG